MLLLEELSFFYGNEGSTGGTEEFVLVRFFEFVNTVNSVGFTLIGGSMWRFVIWRLALSNSNYSTNPLTVIYFWVMSLW